MLLGALRFPDDELPADAGGPFGLPQLTWRKHEIVTVELEPRMFHPRTIPGLGRQTEDDWRRTKAFSESSAGRELFVVVSGDATEYSPLEEHPRLFLEFASVGEMWGRDWRLGQEALVKFVQQFGLPRGPLLDVSPDGEQVPATVPRRCELVELGEEAIEMYFSVLFLDAIMAARTDGDLTKFESLREIVDGFPDGGEAIWPRRAWSVVAMLLRRRLAGTNQVILFPFSNGDGITPYFACTSLSAGLWLQAYYAALQGRFVRAACKGCGRPFDARDSRQRYCDRFCRNASNQRALYKRKRAATSSPRNSD